MRILLVEDDEKLKEALCFQLQKEGIETDSCTDGEEGQIPVRTAKKPFTISGRASMI